MSRSRRKLKARRRWTLLLLFSALASWYWAYGDRSSENASELSDSKGVEKAAYSVDSRSKQEKEYPDKANPSPEALRAQTREGFSGNGLSDWLSPLKNFPQPDTFAYHGKSYRAVYGTDSLLQARVAKYMRRYHPEKAAFLVADLKTGHLLAASESETTSVASKLDLSLKATYPAASLIKIVTAAAGLENGLRGPEDSLPQLGANHTLYRSQIHEERCHSCPHVELREAFARSINPAFAILGLRVGANKLQTTAEKFGFNAAAISPLWQPSAYSAPDSGFHLAEVACGFTDKSTLSPMHALQIARAVGDDGRLLIPILAPRLEPIDGSVQSLAPYVSHSASAKVPRVAAGETLSSLQELMEATTHIGTARKGFHRAMRADDLQHLETGGKTGSLDGDNPKGRYEWFIGYVRLKEEPDKGLAIAIMTINENYLAIHPAELAAYVVKDWLRVQLKLMRQAKSPQKPANPDANKAA